MAKMTRPRTKAEILAEQALRDKEYYEELVRNWFPRLMAVMMEADEISVPDTESFRILIRGNYSNNVQYDLPVNLDPDDNSFNDTIYCLQEFEDMIVARKLKEEKERIQAQLRNSGLSKLSHDEKVALGLMTK